MEPNSVTDDAEFKELNATLRHYSNLRFLAMPIFFTINGGLLVAIQNDKIRCVPNVFITIGVLSCFLFFFFAAFEYRLHLYLEKFVQRARELKPNGFWARRPGHRIGVTLLLIALYGVVVAHWWMLALNVSRAGCP